MLCCKPLTFCLVCRGDTICKSKATLPIAENLLQVAHCRIINTRVVESNDAFEENNGASTATAVSLRCTHPSQLTPLPRWRPVLMVAAPCCMLASLVLWWQNLHHGGSRQRTWPDAHFAPCPSQLMSVPRRRCCGKMSKLDLKQATHTGVLTSSLCHVYARSKRSAALQAELEARLAEIVRSVNERKDHIPPVVSPATVTFPFEIAIAGCVPLDCIPENAYLGCVSMACPEHAGYARW